MQPHRTRAEVRTLEAALLAIVEEIRPATVRQVFYQAVVAGLVPKEETRGYRHVQHRLLRLRERGVMPYAWITDGARLVRGYDRYGSLETFLREIAGLYRRDYWAEASERVEVWCEKDALAGVLFPVVVEEFGLDLYVSRGFSSTTYLYAAGAAIRRDGRPTHVYILSDFDPSGLKIAEHIRRDLARHAGTVPVFVQRLAVTPEQIAALGLPTRPTKRSDPRAAAFLRHHDTGSVELDAISPDELRRIVRSAIERHMDSGRLAAMRAVEAEERQYVAALGRRRSGEGGEE